MESMILPTHSVGRRVQVCHLCSGIKLSSKVYISQGCVHILYIEHSRNSANTGNMSLRADEDTFPKALQTPQLEPLVNVNFERQDNPNDEGVHWCYFSIVISVGISIVVISSSVTNIHISRDRFDAGCKCLLHFLGLQLFSGIRGPPHTGRNAAFDGETDHRWCRPSVDGDMHGLASIWDSV